MFNQLLLIILALLMAGANTMTAPAPDTKTQPNGGSRQCEVVHETDDCM
jgi:hypothetical protein